MPESLGAYCRDTNLPEHILAQYRPGLIFREPTLCDASQHLGGFAAAHRYLLLSGSARHVDALFGGLSGLPGSGLSVWQADTRWKVLSVHRHGEHAQITLLEIPPVALEAFNAQPLTTLERDLVEKAETFFQRALVQEAISACSEPIWLERVEHPLGINDDCEFLECWFNGIRQGTAIVATPAETTPLRSPKTNERVSVTETSAQLPTQLRPRLLKRGLGAVIVTTGIWLAISLIGSDPHPGQIIFLALVMIVFGGLIAWRPDDIQ